MGGKWVAPVKGQYCDAITPINGNPYPQVARSSAEDIERALDAAHAAADKWGKPAPAALEELRLEAKLSREEADSVLGELRDSKGPLVARMKQELDEVESLAARYAALGAEDGHSPLRFGLPVRTEVHLQILDRDVSFLEVHHPPRSSFLLRERRRTPRCCGFEDVPFAHQRLDGAGACRGLTIHAGRGVAGRDEDARQGCEPRAQSHQSDDNPGYPNDR